MLNLKKTIGLSLVTTLLLTTGLYSEDYHDGDQGWHETAPEKESIDVSHNIIMNIYSTKQQRKKAQKSKKEKKATSSFSSLIIMDSERSAIEQNSNDSTSSAFKLSYDKDFTDNSDIGGIFSYRNTEDDNTNLKSQEFLLSPYYKYYKDITDNIDIEAVANLLIGTRDFSGGSFSIDSYQTYGVGATIVPGYYIGEKIMLNAPIGLQSIKRSGAKDEDINTFINYGIGGEYKIFPNWFINTNVLRTQDIDSDTKIAATYYVVQTNYYGEYWNFGLGYKTVQGVSKYSEDTFMLSVQYNW